jgi:hypothetical protein
VAQNEAILEGILQQKGRQILSLGLPDFYQQLYGRRPKKFENPCLIGNEYDLAWTKQIS